MVTHRPPGPPTAEEFALLATSRATYANSTFARAHLTNDLRKKPPSDAIEIGINLPDILRCQPTEIPVPGS